MAELLLADQQDSPSNNLEHILMQPEELKEQHTVRLPL